MIKRILIFITILMVFQGYSQVNRGNGQTGDRTETDFVLRAFELKTSNPLYYLLGKDVFGKEAIEFTGSLGISEKESTQSYIHLQYFDSGVEIVYNADNNKISSIFLLAPNYGNGYKPYTGELPYEFNWNTTKSEVESTIGYGKEQQPMHDVYYRYEHHKIEILYFKDSEDPKIQSIQIRNFEEPLKK